MNDRRAIKRREGESYEEYLDRKADRAYADLPPEERPKSYRGGNYDPEFNRDLDMHD